MGRSTKRGEPLEIAAALKILQERAESPAFLRQRFDQLRADARAFLKDRDAETVQTVGRAWEHLLKAAGAGSENPGNSLDAGRLFPMIREWLPASGREALVSLEQYPPTVLLTDPDLPLDLRWSEVLAVLALSHLGSALIEADEPHSDWESAAASMIDAQEALGAALAAWLAERGERQTAGKADHQQRAQRREAARTRHADRERLKAEFVAFFQAGGYTNRSQAARLYYRALDSEDQRTLAPSGRVDNAVRTLTRHLRSVLNPA